MLAAATLLPCAASAKTGGLAGLKHDSSAPIEINADALEVLQEQNKAIFSGHVVAIQNDVRLKADKMTVHYKRKESEGGKQAAPEGDSGAIQKIEADGSVFLTTTGETASGASGTYDVENQMIYLNNNVVLTRGQNILKGDKLTYNFATGKSVVTSGGAQPDGKKGDRVRALFIPGSEKKPTKDAKTP